MSDTTRTYRMCISRGKRALDRGDHAYAIDAYTLAIRLCPEELFAYYQRGLAYYASRQWESAISDLSQVIGQGPYHRNVYFLRGKAYQRAGKFQDSIADLTRVIVDDPQDGEAYLVRGHAHLSAEFFPMAIEDFSKAIELCQDMGLGHFWRAETYARQYLYLQALSDYQSAIEIDPKDPCFYLGKARVERVLGRWNSAMENVSHALELKPDYRDAFSLRGMLYADALDFRQSVLDHSRVIEMGGDTVEERCCRGRAFFKLDQYAEGRADLLKALEFDAESEQAHSLMKEFENAIMCLSPDTIQARKKD